MTVMPRLSAEESLVLLTCRPYLQPLEAALLPGLVGAAQDWAYVLWRAEQYRMLPLLQHHLTTTGTLDRVPAVIQTYIARWAELSRRRSLQQLRELARIAAAFAAEGIDYFLLKGCGVAVLYYEHPLLRPMQDIDLIVRPADAPRVQQLLFELGYEHGIWDSDAATFTRTSVRLTAQRVAASIEIPPFTKLVRTPSPFRQADVPAHWRRQHVKCAIARDGTLTIPIFVDVHTNLSEGLDVDDVWHGRELHAIGGRPVWVQSPTAMVWFIAARVYLEAFVYNTLKLSMLGDLHTVLHKAGTRVDWAELSAVAYKYGMRPALFYVLAQVRTLTSCDVPLAVLALLRPDHREIPLANDFGDVLPKLLSHPLVTPFESFRPERSA
jgi:hypothetical protein